MKLSKLFNIRSYKNLLLNMNKYGRGYLSERILKRFQKSNFTYHKWYDQVKPSSHDLDKQRNHKFSYTPTISIIVPVCNPPVKFLKEMLDSVLNQTYSRWELCIANVGKKETKTYNLLLSYKNIDKRIKIINLDKNLGISGNSNKAIELAKGEYVSFLDHDDILPQYALYEVVSVLQKEQHDILYSDEDFISEDLQTKISHHFKPDWSPHLLECHNYITHFMVIKKSLLDEVGYFRRNYDGAQDYDLILRCTEKSKDVYHIPKILYHWRMHQGSVAGDSDSKKYAYDAGLKALEDHYKRRGIEAVVSKANVPGYYQSKIHPKGDPFVSIIIPNKDHVEDLKKCLRSLLNVNTYKNFEIIIVENNSDQKSTFIYYDDLQEKYSNIKVIKYKFDFNYSAINNYGTKFAKGDYLLFLNNDTELITSDGISQMLGSCMLPEVGIVGAKLLYDDDTVQHAGIVVGFDGYARSVFTGLGKDDPGYANKACVLYDCSAVTAACMMVSKEIFNKINGFSEDYKVACNDVDFCMKNNKIGKYTVCDNFVHWYHFESKSRGLDIENDETKKRFFNEINLFQKRWAEVFAKGDPFYNKNFLHKCLPYSQEEMEDLHCCLESYLVKPHNKDKFNLEIQGWCVSDFGNPIKIELFVNDIKTENSVIKTNKKELFDSNLTDSFNNLSGFICKSLISNKDKVYIKFSTTKSNKIFKYTFKQLSLLSYITNRPVTNINKNVDNIYNEWYKSNKLTNKEIQRQKDFKFKNNPKFSFVIPLYKSNKKFLDELISSIKNQTYEKWEVCFSDASGSNKNLKSFIKKYSIHDKRIKYIKSDKQLHISDNTNLALSIVTGDYIVFGDHDDLFEPNALFECVKLINKHPFVEMIYSDEDKIDMDGNNHFYPHFKPDFNMDMLRSENYICHMCVISKKLYDKVGKVNHEFDGSQDYDYVLRCTEKTNEIRHISKILYNWRVHDESTAGSSDSKNYANDAGLRALQAYYNRQEINAKAKHTELAGIYKTNYFVDDSPLVSVIISNCDNKEKIIKCVNSILDTNSYKNIEILIVANSHKRNKNIKNLLIKKFTNSIKILDFNQDNTNNIKAYNYGAKYAKGEFLLFLHGDVEIIKPESIFEMLMHCNRNEVGAVGAKLYYEDDTIQHAGITIGLKGCFGYNFEGFNKKEYGYVCRTHIVQDVSAVTGACIMTKKSLFLKINGFDENLIGDYSAVDYCLNIGESKFLVVFTPYAQFYHYKHRYPSYEYLISNNRNKSEEAFIKKWNEKISKTDYFYNKNLSITSTDFSIDLC